MDQSFLTGAKMLYDMNENEGSAGLDVVHFRSSTGGNSVGACSTGVPLVAPRAFPVCNFGTDA